jgi:hypothetical protein
VVVYIIDMRQVFSISLLIGYDIFKHVTLILHVKVTLSLRSGINNNDIGVYIDYVSRNDVITHHFWML